MTRQKTAAEIELEARLRQQPPTYPLNSAGADRVRALARVLKLPQELERRVQDGTLVFGEVGDLEPDARTSPLGEENFVVVLTSGMMDFLYAVGRAMSGASVMWSHGMPINRKALSGQEIAALTADVFTLWRKHCQPSLWDLFWREKRIEHATFQLSELAHQQTEDLITSAELFMLAHELGHVALRLGLYQINIKNEELKADSVGLYLYLPAAQEWWGPRSALAGAGFAVRVLSGLNRAGATFTSEYPPAAARLRNLLEAMRYRCQSEQFFDEAATVMVANFELMDVVDGIIDSTRLSKNSPWKFILRAIHQILKQPPTGPKNDLAVWQVSVRMLAVLLEVASGDQAPAVFVNMFEDEMQRTPKADMRAIAEKLLRYYPAVPQGAAYITAELRAKMSAELDKCIQSMSAPARALFGMAM